MMLFVVTAMRPDLLIKFLMGPRDTCGKVREDVRDLYVAKKSKNASRLSALSDEWDNLTQVAIRMGYPRELMSDDLFGAVQTYCEARQETQLQLQRRLGAAPSPSAWQEGSPPRGASLAGADLISPSAPPRRAKLPIGNGEAHSVSNASSVAVGQPRTEARKWPANSLVANRSQSHSARARPEEVFAEASPHPSEEDAEDDDISREEEDAESLPEEPAIEKRRVQAPVRASARAPAKALAAGQKRELETTQVKAPAPCRALKGSSTPDARPSQKPDAAATPNAISKVKAKSPSASAAADAVVAWDMPSLHIPDAAAAAPMAKRRKRGEPQPTAKGASPPAAAAVVIACGDAGSAEEGGDTPREEVAVPDGGIITPRGDGGPGSADESTAADGEGGDVIPGSLEERLALAEAQQSEADGQDAIFY